MEPTGRPRASKASVALAMGALYFFWGSTYLGIKVAVEGYEPFFMAGIRNLIAGILIYTFVRARGTPKPSLHDWKAATIVGGLLLLGGNGLVTYASRYAPSGLVSVIVATMPLWMVLLDRPRDADGKRSPYRPVVLAGVLVGLCGVILLIAPKIAAALHATADGVSTMEAVAMGAALVSPFSWAVGSIISKRTSGASTVSSPTVSPWRNTGMQLICGGVLLGVASVAMGEPGRMDSGKMFASPWPTLSIAYLVVFGSLVGYSAYIWLLGVIPAAQVATYAYVNPIVALALGWALGGEGLSGRALLAATIIIGSVAVIVTARASPAPAPPGDEARPDNQGDGPGRRR